jgi:hypothetical protein
MNNSLLSILICSLQERKEQLGILLSILYDQIGDIDNVEIVTNIDNREITTGEKRNRLLNSCNSEYCCFIDDDDNVSDDYVDSIVKALQSRSDCLGIEGIYTVNGENPIKFIHSIKYNSWFKQGEVFYRPPNHLNPVKTEIARVVGFPDKILQEDKAFSLGLVGKLVTEVYIDHPIYFYNKIKK